LKVSSLDRANHGLARQDVGVLEGLDEEFGVDVTLFGNFSTSRATAGRG